MEPGTLPIKKNSDLLWIALFEFIGTTIFFLALQYTT